MGRYFTFKELFNLGFLASITGYSTKLKLRFVFIQGLLGLAGNSILEPTEMWLSQTPQMICMQTLGCSRNYRSVWPHLFRVFVLLGLSAGVLSAQCEDISGVWQVHEKVLITFSAPGFDDEIVDMDEMGSVTLVQDGCDISYSLPIGSQSFLRSAVL